MAPDMVTSAAFLPRKCWMLQDSLRLVQVPTHVRGHDEQTSGNGEIQSWNVRVLETCAAKIELCGFKNESAQRITGLLILAERVCLTHLRPGSDLLGSLH